MAYTKNMEEAAQRHYADGRKLHDEYRYDNAGYHYGFAAECALKHCLLRVGVRGDDESIWAHYPAMRERALLALRTRTAASLRALFERQNFMQGWDTDIRYAADGSVSKGASDKWCKDANEAIGLLYQ